MNIVSWIQVRIFGTHLIDRQCRFDSTFLLHQRNLLSLTLTK